MRSLGIALSLTFTTIISFFRNPRLLLPFFLVFLIQFASLLALSFFLQPPFAGLFVPLVERFYGNTYLHYPANFLVVIRLFERFRLFLDIFLGIFAAGVTVNAIVQFRQDGTFSFRKTIQKTWRRYGALLLFSLLLYFILFYLSNLEQLTFSLFARSDWNPGGRFNLYLPYLVIAGGFLLSLIAEVFFIYTIPLLFVRNHSLTRAISGSFRTAGALFFPTFFLLLFPMLVYFVLLLGKGQLPLLMERIYPEIVPIYLLILSIVGNAANLFTTAAPTVLFLLRSAENKQ